jgi:hypothetical protein
MCILYEGFKLLPESMVVLPGVFRLSDVFIILLPLVLLVFFGRIVHLYRSCFAESQMVMAMTAMVFIGPLMALIYFDQPYLVGLSFIRHNLEWLVFFPFALLLGDLEGVEKFIKVFTVFIGAWVLLLILTKYVPTLGIIDLRHGYYAKGGFVRFGDFRLFLPYGSVPIYLFCIALARQLHGRVTGEKIWNWISLGFVLLVFYAIVATFTRSLVVALLVVSLYAISTCRQRLLRYFGFGLALLLVAIQGIGMAAGTGGFSFIEESNLGKMALMSDKLQKESGRSLQSKMCVDNFLKSPVAGVGNLVSGKLDYEKNMLMRTFRKYGFFSAGDIGYLKIAAENGLFGICWIVWFYWHLYRRSKEIIVRAKRSEESRTAETIGWGTIYFMLYLLVSGFTIPHFISADGIPIVALALAILAVTRRSISNQVPTVSEAIPS